jgi:hypothetical protein
MNELQNLLEGICANAANPREAYQAIMKIGGLFEIGSQDVSQNLGAAFACYEKAAQLDGPEAYLALSRLCRLACIATEDDKPEIKAEYANYARMTCDPDTILRFGWPEIALNVGVICDYISNYAARHHLPEEAVREYAESAASFYSLATKMKDINDTNAPALCAAELAKLQERRHSIGKVPTLKNTPEPPHP